MSPQIQEEHKVGFVRGLGAAAFMFLVEWLSNEAGFDRSVLAEAGKLGLLAAAPFWGFGIYDAARRPKA